MTDIDIRLGDFRQDLRAGLNATLFLSDIPYNLGFDYGPVDDSLSSEAYRAFIQDFVRLTYEAAAPDAHLFVIHYPEHFAEMWPIYAGGGGRLEVPSVAHLGLSEQPRREGGPFPAQPSDDPVAPEGPAVDGHASRPADLPEPGRPPRSRPEEAGQHRSHSLRLVGHRPREERQRRASRLRQSDSQGTPAPRHPDDDATGGPRGRPVLGERQHRAGCPRSWPSRVGQGPQPGGRCLVA